MGLIIYTDGACSGNPGPGGWAWAIENGPFKSGTERPSTNQRMELMAVLDAVKSNEGPLEIVSDSTYVVNCFKDKWHVGWLKRGWVNSKNQPVANRDIWEPLIQNVVARKNVSFRWVKGHSGHPMNDLVDRLAVEAAQSGQGRSGGTEPTQAAPAKAAKSPPPAKPTSTVSSPQTLENGAQFVVVFRAKLRSLDDPDYAQTAARMRELCFTQFGCVDFQAVTQGAFEIAVSYFRSEADIVAWKQNAEHVLAQKRGSSEWYESYSVEVARVVRGYHYGK